VDLADGFITRAVILIQERSNLTDQQDGGPGWD
jgi:hypothetical protein